MCIRDRYKEPPSYTLLEDDQIDLGDQQDVECITKTLMEEVDMEMV